MKGTCPKLENWILHCVFCFEEPDCALGGGMKNPTLE